MNPFQIAGVGRKRVEEKLNWARGLLLAYAGIEMEGWGLGDGWERVGAVGVVSTFIAFEYISG